jgi:hypothetical protein
MNKGIDAMEFEPYFNGRSSTLKGKGLYGFYGLRE